MTHHATSERSSVALRDHINCSSSNATPYVSTSAPISTTSTTTTTNSGSRDSHLNKTAVSIRVFPFIRITLQVLLFTIPYLHVHCTQCEVIDSLLNLLLCNTGPVLRETCSLHIIRVGVDLSECSSGLFRKLYNNWRICCNIHVSAGFICLLVISLYMAIYYTTCIYLTRQLAFYNIIYHILILILHLLLSSSLVTFFRLP